MSALNFIFAREAVYIAADTLLVRHPDKQPLQFTSKIFPVPHLDMVICGTGLQLPLLRWFAHLIMERVATGVEDINGFAQDTLQGIHYESLPPSSANGLSATIYQFAFAEQLNEFTAFAYRSENNFRPEQFGECFAMKPQLPSEIMATLNLDTSNFDLVTDFTALISAQRTYDESRPFGDRVGIGGDIQVCMMQKARMGRPVSIQLVRVHRFADFHQQLATMRSVGPPSA